MSRGSKAVALVFLCLAWGINWVAIKVSLEGFPPMLGASCRFAIAVVPLYFYVKWKGVSLRMNGYQFKFLLIAAFLTYAVDYGLLFWAEQYLSAGVSSIFFSTFVLFTAVFSNFVFKNEPFNKNQYLGLLVGLVGILLVFYDQIVNTRYDFYVIIASAAVLVAALGAAVGTVVVKKYLSKMNTVALSFHQMFMGTIILALISLPFENVSQIHLNSRIVITMLYMGIVASAAAFLVYFKLLNQMSAISLSFIIYVIPIVALFADYVIYGEVLSLRAFIGMVIIFLGIHLSMGKGKAKKQSAGSS